MAKTRTKTSDKSKTEAARKKAEELLSDLPEVVSKKSEEKKPTSKSVEDKKSTAWLEEQLEVLTKANEELEARAVKAEEDYKKLLQSKPQQQDDASIKAAVKGMFVDLESAFLGRNPERTRYVDAKIEVLLNKMLQRFPFLRKK